MNPNPEENVLEDQSEVGVLLNHAIQLILKIKQSMQLETQISFLVPIVFVLNDYAICYKLFLYIIWDKVIIYWLSSK